MTYQDTKVSVLTARQMAAIASVSLGGPDAQTILEKVFRTGSPAAWSASDTIGSKLPDNAHPGAGASGYCTGSIHHGSIVDGETLIDEVVVGCEEKGEFVIHCHGNPLLVEQIVKLCQSHGAVLTDAAEFTGRRYREQSQTMIEAEIKQALRTCATLSGAKIISNQRTSGLLPLVQNWHETIDTISLPQLWAECHRVLRKTSRGRYLINRCRLVIVGPPNSGKSTLLNQLAGTDEVIVSQTAGTTRDWVRITCHVGPLLADIYDTAGLDEALMAGREVDTMAQQRTLSLIRSADMNIFIYDVTDELAAQSLLFSLGSLKAIVAANKCDLLAPEKKRNLFGRYVPLVAKTGDGIERLCEQLLRSLKVKDFDLASPVCFTDHQLFILRQILHVKEKSQAKQLIQTLLFGDNSV